MEAIWNSGIAFIVLFQSLGEWLVTPMKFFSFLGSEEFFLLSLPLLYWSVDTGLGLRVGIIFLFSGSVNSFLKLGLRGPRPYWYSTLVKAYSMETSFGVPSGHAQIAMSLWGMIAAVLKRQWAWLAAIFIVLMIGLSRLFLAVHFPHDVLMGWVIGALILWAFARFWHPVSAWANKKSFGQQIGLAFAASLVLLICGVIPFGTLQGWDLPVNWLANIQQAGFDELPAPVSLDSTITFAAVMFGMFAGVAWMNLRGGYEASGSGKQRILRLLPGMLGIVIIYLGLRAIFPQGDTFTAYLLRYLRYALIGLWVTAGGPWIFQKMKLAKNQGI